MGTSMRFVTYEEVLGDATPMMKGLRDGCPPQVPWHAPLARHLIESLVRQEFDVAAIADVPQDGQLASVIRTGSWRRS